MENSRNEKFIGFKLHTVLRGVLKSCTALSYLPRADIISLSLRCFHLTHHDTVLQPLYLFSILLCSPYFICGSSFTIGVYMWGSIYKAGYHPQCQVSAGGLR